MSLVFACYLKGTIIYLNNIKIKRFQLIVDIKNYEILLKSQQ